MEEDLYLRGIRVLAKLEKEDAKSLGREVGDAVELTKSANPEKRGQTDESNPRRMWTRFLWAAVLCAVWRWVSFGIGGMNVIMLQLSAWWYAYWAIPGRGQQLAQELKFFIWGISAIYLPAAWAGSRLMHKRSSIQKHWAVLSWNSMLSVLSFCGVIVMLRHWHILLTPFYSEAHYPASVRSVISIFTLTKAVEYVDTFLLILKKKPLSFLHLYHHFTVTLYCWHAQAVNVSFAHHFVFLNLAVHTCMYAYYALVVAIRSPTSKADDKCIYMHNWMISKRRTLSKLLQSHVRQFITTFQVLQMLIGSYLSFNAIVSNTLPDEHVLNAHLALAMYVSYAWLFAKLFIENYVQSMRPSMTIFVGIIHLLAIAGAYMLLHSGRWIRLLLELLGTYGLTATFLHMFSALFVCRQQVFTSQILQQEQEPVEEDRSTREYPCNDKNYSINKPSLSYDQKSIVLNQNLKRGNSGGPLATSNLRYLISSDNKRHTPKITDNNDYNHGEHNTKSYIAHCRNTVFFYMTRMLLMLLNCMATWACEYQIFRNRIEFVEDNSKVSNNNKYINERNDKTESSTARTNFIDKKIDSSIFDRQDNCKYTHCGIKSNSFSLLRCLVTKPDRQSSCPTNNVNNPNNNKQKESTSTIVRCSGINNDTDIREANAASFDVKGKNASWYLEYILEKTHLMQMKHVSPELHNVTKRTLSNKLEAKMATFSFYPLDYWFALMSFSIPAVYTLTVYGDLLTGICIHGALRWILELHTLTSLSIK